MTRFPFAVAELLVDYLKESRQWYIQYYYIQNDALVYVSHGISRRHNKSVSIIINNTGEIKWRENTGNTAIETEYISSSVYKPDSFHMVKRFIKHTLGKVSNEHTS